MAEKRQIIRVKRLFKKFEISGPGEGAEEYNEVLKDINFDVEEGEFVIIVGPSGCGKTTFLNCITGLEPVSDGHIFIKKNDISKLSEDQRADIRADKFGIIYQMAYWVKSLTVLENTALPLLVQGEDLEPSLKRAEFYLKEVGLEKRFHYHPAELSGGEQTRVSIARALIGQGEIVMADEPTGNLDVKSGRKILSLLQKLNKEKGVTIIMITHNLDYLRYASRKIVMEDGQIVGDSEQADTKLAEKLEEKIRLLNEEKEEVVEG